MGFLRTIIGLALGLTLFISSWGLLPSHVIAQEINPYLKQATERVTEFTLDNGLKFIVMENRDAPVVSFFTYADVGGVDEPVGKTGVAHFLEHLAFKGTREIGTTDYQAEKAILDRQDQVYDQIQTAKKLGKSADVKQLSQEFEQLQAQANQFVKQNEFGQIVERSGGVGLNAATSADATVYFYSFPANKLEMWMSLESERFLDPVFREFYKEKEVILEERRLRTDNNPVGQMIEAFIDKAFTKHPYKRPVIGYDEDIRNLSREDVTQFFNAYYPPNNLTIAIVGDVDAAKVEELAKIYFGRYTAKPKPSENISIEPQQTASREVDLTLPSQPWYFKGYHRPELNHPDNAIYEVITTLMSNGRTSRLYRSLVEDKQIALVAQGFNGFPGDKYPNLILFYAMTSPNGTLEEVQKALNQEIERLKNEPVSEKELQRAKNQLRAQLLRTLNSNSGMAQALAEYDVKTGSWRNLFNQIDQFSAVSAEDIQRVAISTFKEENSTIGRIQPAQ
ncbi:pitrilysin family protein [Chroococcus sp. FPU101]|uniref:M16 family metallopeptidase n=1 Tax=Chroococcus sp. FPU101 TaxID=1974212 RepID=UPI001A8DFB1E|nr:pitrilysin family protein [Chroococcus sp. FPU101]GFE70491.1 peptidase M16 domain protein [Chroococcus sp. FPU101]